MLRLQHHFLSSIGASSHRHCSLLSIATTAITPDRFVAEEYLVTTCGLTPAQAGRASKGLTHLKSPVKPDAVVAFLAGVGLAKDDIIAGIARYPRLLCSKVDKTLTPRFAQLMSLGLSPSQISRLITIVPNIFVAPKKISHLQFYLSFMGCFDRVHSAIRINPMLLSRNLEDVVKPNIAFLLQCGLTVSNVLEFPLLIGMRPESVRERVACAEKLGVPRNTGMFKSALWAVYCVGPNSIGAKLDVIKATLGCSEAELTLVVRKSPPILRMSEGKLSRALKFLKVDVGLKLQYILLRPAILAFSMQRRLMPRHYFIKILKAKGLVKENVDFYNALCLTEKRFAQKFIDPYNQSIAGLADAYAAACAGKMPHED
ncbi:Transcription termination factor MTERF8, chloroplastic [Zea mays]|jgi:mTERF domain-containing protein, mitochondrial|uniref:Mitochondrial transcription termination factor family protein n=2 Tax=Zea mays TaxID=4577 RepID=A0A1D6HKX7_MAIZE|nr:mTERF transcription factor [Zea mays]AQK75077.1 Mitochondrial transcription termination factor family protein [Zea mays]AQK75078.1 Mitochondrial transcription termination factor family protein [Zea mays]PWZ22665.1 Transcription termination factor MTERF8, chloroplastic [Zea mays]|eukprot:NP_001146079.2 mTERF transcription factor [Zea mays]